jgi:hypothetical protein
MQSAQRQRLALAGFLSLFGIQLLIVAAMFAHAFLTGRDPSPLWLLPAGFVITVTGLHIILFRHEFTELARTGRGHLLLGFSWIALYSAKLLIPSGLLIIFIDLGMLAKALGLL